MSRFTSKKLIMPGAFAGLAIIAVLAFNIMTIGNRPVSAEQLASKGIHAVSKLSTSEEDALNKRVRANAATELKKAKASPNLKTLTYDEAKVLEPFVALTNGPEQLMNTDDFSKLSYLSYRDERGVLHIIGIEKNNLPALILSSSDSNGFKQSNFQMQDKNGKTIMGGSVQAGPSMGGGDEPRNCKVDATNNLICETQESNTIESPQQPN